MLFSDSFAGYSSPPQHLNIRELQASVLGFILFSNYTHSLVMSFSLVALSIVHTLKIYILKPDLSFELHIGISTLYVTPPLKW